MRAVFKLGGSLLADPPRLGGLLAALADGDHGPCLIVPGGGPFADKVRADQAAEGYSDAIAHRRALDAMGRMALHLRGIEERLALVRTPWEADSGATALVWDPAALREGHPDIPESWDVTSDSLALWLAVRVNAPSCTLVKSADAPPGSGPEDLARSGLVDAAFPAFARSFLGSIVIWGPGGPVPVVRRRAA